MWCRLCCAPLHGDGFLLRHGPVDFHFCDAQHYKLWQKHRLDPRAYWILRSMPDERARLLLAGVTTAEFQRQLQEQCSSNLKAQ
jgi:hypothetical protein